MPTSIFHGMHGEVSLRCGKMLSEVVVNVVVISGVKSIFFVLGGVYIGAVESVYFEAHTCTAP